MSSAAKGNVEDIYALGPVQQGMFFHSLLEPELAPYVAQGSWVVDGPLDCELFERSWNVLAERHPVLRTVFRQARKQPVQMVLQRRPVSLAVHDLSGLAGDEQAAEARRLRVAEAA